MSDFDDTPYDLEPLLASLRVALREALRARDARRTSVVRGLLHALEHLGAVDPSVPSAATEVPRRIPSAREVAERLRQEVVERETAARTYEDVGQSESADRLRAEAEIVRAWLLD